MIRQIKNSKTVNCQPSTINFSRGGFTPLENSSPFRSGMTNPFFCFLKNALSFRRGALTGFTLIEIMVVLFILAILAAIVAPRLIGRTDDARVVEAKVQIKNFETALKLFKMDNGFYPSTEQGLESLVTKPSTGRIPKNYREGGYLERKKIILDPWGNPYIYISPGTQGDYDIICYGADGERGGEGYDADIINWEM